MSRSFLSLFCGSLVLVGCMTVAAPTTPPDGSTSAADDALARMDPRTPVPLLPMMASHQKRNMRDHLAAVQAIVGAIGSDDFAAVEQAATRIGSSATMAGTCTDMGAAAPGFTEQGLLFHHTADRITEAARSQDRAGVLAALDATLQTCTACHAAWKQQIVDEATWQRLTASVDRAR